MDGGGSSAATSSRDGSFCQASWLTGFSFGASGKATVPDFRRTFFCGLVKAGLLLEILVDFLI